MPVRLARRASRRPDEGFTLVEVTVALFVVALVLTSMLGLFLSAAASTTVGKQRQAATALANQAMEQLRALPYDVVTAGLNASDSLSADANLRTAAGSPCTAADATGGLCRFRPTYNSSIDDVLQTNSTTNQAPLYPHRQAAVSENRVPYTISTYVTQVSGATPKEYWLTTVVSWASNATSARTKTISLRSRLYSPTGCLSTATHPFSGPCQAFFHGAARLLPGSITVTPASSAPAVQGTDFSSAELTLPRVSSAVQAEQVVTVNGTATTSATSMTTTGGTTSSGGISATSSADNDPGTPTSGSSSSATATQSYTALTAPGGAGTLTLAPRPTETGSSVSTTAATTAPPGCLDLALAAVTTGLPCGSGRVDGSGAAGYLDLDLSAVGGLDLPAMRLASAAGTGSTARTVAARYTTTTGTYCKTTSGVGCVVAAVSQAQGDTVLGGLPDPAGTTATLNGLVFPALFTGVLKITGYTARGSAENGIGPAAPVATTTGGQLKYWNGVDYTTTNLSGALPGAVAVPSVSASYVLGTTTVSITIDTVVTVGSATTTTSGATPCTSACVTQSTVTAPTATLRYTISSGGSTLASFNVTANLGGLLAKSTYQAARSG
jgi:Tfp pilus assembly protein PilV